MMRHTPVSRFIIQCLALLIAASAPLSAIAKDKYATIQYGERSDAVRIMQTALKKRGHYKGVVDGHFGPATKTAVRKFQASIGLGADGKPGNRTLTALYDGGSRAVNEVSGKKSSGVQPKDPNSLYYGCTGARVTTLQKALKAVGCFKGTVDGVYGDLTEWGVRKFQASRKMHVDGIAGKKTLNALNRAQKTVKIGGGFILDIGSKGETVKSLQLMLMRMKNYSMGSDTLGSYGKGTAAMAESYFGSPTVTQAMYNALVLEYNKPKK